MIFLFMLGFLSTACTSYRYTIVSRGYKLEQRTTEIDNGKLEFKIDSASENSPVIRILVKNTGDNPVFINKRTANLALGDTIVNDAPFADGAYAEYSYHSSSGLSSAASNSTLGINPYAYQPTERVASASNSTSIMATSGTTVTRLPVPEVVVYPKQVLSLAVDSPVIQMLSEGIAYTYLQQNDKKYTRRAKLNNSSENEELIDKEIAILQHHYLTIGLTTYSLTLTYRSLGEEQEKVARAAFGIRDVDVRKRVDYAE
jgi:hypothetical protein